MPTLKPSTVPLDSVTTVPLIIPGLIWVLVAGQLKLTELVVPVITVYVPLYSSGLIPDTVIVVPSGNGIPV